MSNKKISDLNLDSDIVMETKVLHNFSPVLTTIPEIAVIAVTCVCDTTACTVSTTVVQAVG